MEIEFPFIIEWMFYVIAKYHSSYQGTRCSPFKYENTFTVANSLRRNHILKLSRNYFIAVIIKHFIKIESQHGTNEKPWNFSKVIGVT